MNTHSSHLVRGRVRVRVGVRVGVRIGVGVGVGVGVRARVRARVSVNSRALLLARLPISFDRSPASYVSLPAYLPRGGRREVGGGLQLRCRAASAMAASRLRRSERAPLA